MSVGAELSTTVLTAPPGVSAGADLRVTNTGSEPLTVDVRVGGPAGAWAAVMPAVLVVAPGASARSRLTVDVPPRNALAGTDHELLVALSTGDAPVQLRGRVAVAESREVRASMTPLVARARGVARYTVTVANHGTAPRRVDLDVESGLKVRLRRQHVAVGPGEEVSADIHVRPRRRHLFGRPRPHAVVVRLRPDDGPPLTAAATHFQEPAQWRVGAAAVMAAVVLAGILAVRPGDSDGGGSAVVAPATSQILATTCSEGPDHERVDVAGFAFCPAMLTVALGSEVIWTNVDRSPHTATFDDGFDSGLVAEGQTWRRRFEEPGTYRYYCSFHPGMTGTIVVT